MTTSRRTVSDYIRRILEWAGILLVVHTCIFRFLESTTFYFDFTHTFRVATYSALAVTATLRVLFETGVSWKRADTASKKWKAVLLPFLVLLCAVPFFLAARKFAYYFLAYIPFMVCCLFGSDTRKVMRILVSVLVLLYAVTILCSLSGAISQYVYTSRGEVRSSYGTAYPTDFISFAVYYLLALWSTEKTHRWGRVFGYLLLSAGVIYAAKVLMVSSTSMIIGSLIAFVILFEQLEYRVFDQHRATRWISRVTGVLSAAAFPLLGILFAAFTWLYGHGYSIGIKLNVWLSSRLSLSWKALTQYGLHLLGALTPQNGSGHGLIHTAAYEFLDSTYALLPIRYGLLITGIVAAVWTWMVIRALRNGQKKTALAMAVIAVHSFSEHHFIEPHFNLFLLMPLCLMAPLNKEGTEEAKEPYVSPGTLLIFGFGAAVVLFGLPHVLSLFRAVFALKRWNQNGIPHLWALLCVLGAVLLYLCLLFSLNRLFRQRKNRGLSAALIVLSAGLLGGMYYAGSQVIRQGLEREEPRLNADAPELKKILSAASEPVYAGDLEELYHETVDGLSKRIFSVEELGRRREGTILTDRTVESYPLINTGARYAEISEYSSIYTYDDEVVKALQKDGIAVHGYYSSEREADLSAYARVPMTKENTLLLDAENPRNWGPYIGQFAGTYTAVFELQADPNDLAGEEARDVCILRVNASWGQIALAEKTVRTTDFDETGLLHSEITYTTESDPAVEYLVFLASEIPLELKQTSWRMTPSKDVWKTYNARGLIAEERYFTQEGEPLAQKLGNYGVAYRYDSALTKWTTMQYLDENGEPALNTAGYAQVQRQYNERGQTLTETYLDVSGRPCNTTAGYAVIEKEYDRYGNALVQKTVDAEGNLVVTSAGYAVVRRDYDSHNRVTVEQYYDETDSPVKLGKGYYGVEYGYDAEDYICFYRYLDAEGNPLRIPAGYAELHRIFAGKNRIIEESYYDETGERVLLSEGYAVEQRVYDDVGNIIVRKYLGLDEEPVLTEKGYAELHCTFNEKKQVLSEAYFGTDGKPISLSKGYAALEYGYDKAGNISEIRYFDTEGNPVKTTGGYAEIHREFNDRKKVVMERYYDTEGSPITLAKGQAAVEYGYDEAGNRTSIRYLDREDSPVVITDGYAVQICVYNDARQIVRREYYDANDNPAVLPDGESAVEYTWGEDGTVKEERYYDSAGNLLRTAEKN